MTTLREEDVDRLRRDTPGTDAVVHLNNAGSSLPPRQVTDTVLDYLREESVRGGYETAAAHADRIRGVYDGIARFLGADAADISVTDSATRSWQAVFYAFRFAPGDRILTGRAEYASNAIAYLQIARRTGAVVEVVEDDESGQLDIADLERRLDDTVKLIAITHVPTQGGLVNPAEEVGAIAERAGIPFLLDACQSAGQLDLDVRRLRCDALSATGRKYVRGPRGTGFLYTHPRLRERLEPAMLDLYSATWTAPEEFEIAPDGRRFETWERNYGLVLGLGAAVDYARRVGLPAIEERVTALAARLRADLSQIAGVTVHDQGKRKCGIVTFSVAGTEAAEVQQRLAAAKINTSITRPTSYQYDQEVRNLPAMVRASVHYYNTEDELRALTETVERLA
ncbi:aminotransferase class V-fold PLP-dependent enzyme [Amycolatopsis thermalba]|uniref:Aminotransferase class V-fold PLP-dependent enzyme n=1 Tax=Amycolatopsis thermalba TaxID=944492 RepID=A0ABY4P2P4_9PSEU|nr:aminotransferase [Amycolatopsis sp. KNN50.9b]UQS26506.1 aminotransferase class V-fold PLP-dependent enzyme [Amycolatopsis thermalba]